VADETNQNKVRRDRETVLEELAAFPDAFERLAMRNHTREEWLAPAADGGWGIVEILPHLRDWEEIYQDRAETILREDRPRLPAYDDALWAIERDYRAQDPAETLRQFRDLRQALVALLTAASADAWQREGEHSAYGRITLHWLADHICDHDQEHMQQALDALAS
jgi:hypothetical protein